ncbi:MAG: hypothetical protein UU93_C0013G0013 [Candidatus Amesbacteria bacterium GW2011_GWA2_42_12]|uniref:Holin of 3TMs, for gene-transfer release n=1 Tax=Candidatus Amesbacteria bacterium GW2011_GWA2_42_12 TaxID=1618356 RepID=A0A0G1B2V9_9BACT|nr:MAG: hypothetical protein UU93_C0013G0013 [Candidatus Amesbacteria bacterium GW2011_GWA2_42_12]
MENHVTVEEVKKILEEQPTTYSIVEPDYETQRKISQLEQDKTTAEMLARERWDIMGMRRKWSDWLLRVIISIVFFDFFVILAVGFKWMSFNEGYIVPFFVGESFLKTIGLALIVVGFLFNKDNIIKKT